MGKRSRFVDMGQHVLAAMVQWPKEHSGVQGLAQGPAVVIVVGISGDPTQICRLLGLEQASFPSSAVHYRAYSLDMGAGFKCLGNKTIVQKQLYFCGFYQAGGD